MKISELAEQSGVSIASIKFYIREGMLPAGHTTSRTRADYDERHLARLRLIRALIDVGGLSIAASRSVITAIENEHSSSETVDETVRRALHALGPGHNEVSETHAATRAEVVELINALGWTVETDAPALDVIADALGTLRRSAGFVPSDVLRPYADVAHRLAQAEFESRPTSDDRTTMVEWAVTGTVVFEQILAGLRRLAHNDLANRRIALDAAAAGDGPTG